jgi:hypothetical protein
VLDTLLLTLGAVGKSYLENQAREQQRMPRSLTQEHQFWVPLGYPRLTPGLAAVSKAASKRKRQHENHGPCPNYAYKQAYQEVQDGNRARDHTAIQTMERLMLTYMI